jgi:phage head maturation protease
MNDYIDPALLDALVEVRADPTGERLKRYWTEGEGAAKIRWGVPGDFDRCVRHLEKYVADPKGYCSDMHQRATGARPGHAPSEQRGGEPVTSIEIRSTAGTEVGDVNWKDRIITVLAVPYEEPAPIVYRGQEWSELFSRSAFDGIEKRPTRVRVNREHKKGDTVGKAVAFDPSETRGLVAELKIAKTLRGDETLALADDDCLGPSIGFGLLRQSDQVFDRRSMQRRINTAWIDHIGMVEDPAYTGAGVLGVRNGSDVDLRSPLETPILDDFLSDPVIRRALGLER